MAQFDEAIKAKHYESHHDEKEDATTLEKAKCRIYREPHSSQEAAYSKEQRHMYFSFPLIRPSSLVFLLSRWLCMHLCSTTFTE
jgi:hypothetical protein